jgi:hypothetical protein
MRGLTWTTAGLCLFLLTAQVHADKVVVKDKDKDASSCGSFGTAVQFVETPAEAAARAKKEEKLVFVLHVSGNFEDPKFT